MSRLIASALRVGQSWLCNKEASTAIATFCEDPLDVRGSQEEGLVGRTKGSQDYRHVRVGKQDLGVARRKRCRFLMLPSFQASYEGTRERRDVRSGKEREDESEE